MLTETTYQNICNNDSIKDMAKVESLLIDRGEIWKLACGKCSLDY